MFKRKGADREAFYLDLSLLLLPAPPVLADLQDGRWSY